MRTVESIIKEMEKVDRSMEDASLKKYERLATLDEELRQTAKENKIKLSEIYKKTLLLKSKVDRARRISQIKRFMDENSIHYESIGVAHFEDLFRLKNKYYKEGKPDEAKAEITAYLNQVSEKKQTDLRKEFLPSRERTQKEKAFQEFIEFCKYSIGLREKSPVITCTGDFRKIAFVIHAATKEYAREVEALVKAITINVRNVS